MRNIFNQFAIGSLIAFSSLWAESEAPFPAKKTTNYAAKYTGIDANLGVGYSGVAFETKYSDLARERSSDDDYLGGSGVAIQGRVGASYDFCNYWLVGLDVYGQYNSAEHTYNRSERSFSANSKVAIDANVGVDARLGVVACPSNLFFVTVGPDWGHYTFSYKATHSGVNHSHNFSEFKTGLRVGAGGEQKLSTNWIIKEQFGYSWYSDSTHRLSDGASSTLKTRLATMTFLIGYLF